MKARRLGWLEFMVVLASPCVFLSSAEAGRPDNQRLGLYAVAHPSTGQTDTRAATLGVMYARSIVGPYVWGNGLIAYSAVGEKPGTGMNVFTASLGLEGAYPVHEWFEPFGRMQFVVSQILTTAEEGRWNLENVGTWFQTGVRLKFVELFMSLGLGPAEGFNIGAGAFIFLPFGGVEDQPGSSSGSVIL